MRITPHAEEYLNMEQLSEYMEISDPDRVQPSSNDGGLCDIPYDIQRAERPSSTHFTHPVTYRAFPNEATFRGHPLYSRRQQHDELPIRFPEGRYTLHSTREQQVEADLNFLRSFRTASNVLNPNRITPYVMTNLSVSPDLTDPRHLIPPVAPHVFNRTMGLPFTVPTVPQTPSRVLIGPCYPMTGNSMSNTPARMRSSPTHGLMNGIGNANSIIVVTDQIPILTSLKSYDLRQFIDIITSRAVDNNTALLRTLKLLISPITMRSDGTPVTY